MFERALYYPNIDISNDGWLRSAIQGDIANSGVAAFIGDFKEIIRKT